MFLPFSSTAFSLSAILNNYYGHMTYNWNHVTFFVDFFFSPFLEVSHYHYHAWIIIKLGGGVGGGIVLFDWCNFFLWFNNLKWQSFFVVLIGRFYKNDLRVFRAIYFFARGRLFFNYVWRFFFPLCSLQKLYLCIMPTYSVYLLPFSRLLIGQNARSKCWISIFIFLGGLGSDIY